MKIISCDRTACHIAEQRSVTIHTLVTNYRCADCDGVLITTPIMADGVVTGTTVSCSQCGSQNVTHVAQIRREEIEAAEVAAHLPAELRAMTEEHSDPALVAAAKDLLF